MIVVDASAMVLTFADPASEPRVLAARAALRRDPAWAVPEHWRVEVFSSVRGLLLGGKLTEQRAERVLRGLTKAQVMVVPTADLLPRMWGLRHDLTGYEAGYVAAAELLGCELVTADARIARAGVARCPIQLIS